MCNKIDIDYKLKHRKTNYIPYKYYSKEGCMATLMSDKVDFRTMNITRDKEGRICYNEKESTHQGDIFQMCAHLIIEL